MVDFSPSGTWTVDYASNLCALSRDMMSGDRKVRFSLRPSLNSSEATLVLTEQTTKDRGLNGYPFIRLGDGTRVSASGRRIWRNGTGWIVIALSLEELSSLDRANANLEVWFGDDYYRFHTGNLTNGKAALETCRRDLLKVLGMSEVEQDKMASPPVFPKVSPLRHTDYPAALISRDIEATMTLLLDIAPNGKVTACRGLESSGIPAFDEYACKIYMRRAKFEPALDNSGAPMRALTSQTIRWLIEPNFWGQYYKKD